MPWAMEHAALGRRLRDKLGRRADGTDALQSPGTSDPPPVRATPLDTVVDDASLQHMAKPIQNGFSPQFMLAHSSPTLQTALYIPRHSDQFITVDTNNVYVWIGDKRVKKLRIPSAAVDEKSGGDSAVNVQGHGRANISERRTTVGSTEQTVPALSSATRYCVINKYRLLVVATSRLELVLIDTADFQHQSSVSTAKPVIALSFIEELDMIVAAGVGGVSLWSISKAELSGKRSYQIDAAPKFDFNADFDTDEWVRATCYDHTKQRLYVACEQDFWAYSLDSGKRLGGVREAHRLSLTCIQVHTRTQFVVTGARDFEIKLWNSLLQHVVTFRDHHGPITGLIFLEGDCDAARVQPLSQLEREQRRDPSQDDEDTIVDTFRLRHDHQRLPYLVSTSEDATIRLWHLDSARWIYKQRHDKPIFGMQHMRGETFMFFTKEKTHVWTLDRCFTPFTDVQSHVERMSRVRLDSRTVPVAMQHGLDVERLVVVAEDGSIRLVSPVTAQTITIAFPFYRDVPINEVLYDWRSERLYVWLADGDILTYDCALNPCRIVHQWGSSQNSLAENPSRSNRNTRGNIQCLVGLWMDDAYCMMAGMDTGEVCTVNMERSGKKDVICLAHASPITAMYVCESKRELFTAGTDGVIKVWSVSMRSEMQERETVSTGHLLSATSKLTLTQMGSIPYNTTIYMNPRALSYDKDNERVHAVFQVVYSEVNDTKKPGKNDSIVESIGEQVAK